MAASSSKFRYLHFLLRRTTFSVGHQIRRRVNTAAAESNVEEKWRLLSAVCVERWPVITQAPTKMEDRFGRLIKEMELENSVLSDHEMRHKMEVAMRERSQEGVEDMNMESSTETALDVEDKWEAEAKDFVPADRVTGADKTEDLKSTERKLDRKLVLLVKQKVGDKYHWVFPQGEWTAGESLRQTAERVLKSACGESLSTQFIGNAPCGVYKYLFKTKSELGTGAKVFFFKAAYSGGEVEFNSGPEESYMWVTKQELKGYLHRDYLKSVNPFILEL